MTSGRPSVALERRHGLLLAALPLFARAGYHGVNMPEIAKAAGMATGSVYRHFEGKVHLVNVLLREHYAALYGGLSRASVTGDLRSMFLAVMEFAAQHSDAFALLFFFNHDDYAEPETLALRAQLDTTVRKVIAAHWPSTSTARGPEAAVAGALFWACCAGIVRGQRAGAFAGLDDLNSVAVRLLEHGLGQAPRD